MLEAMVITVVQDNVHELMKNMKTVNLTNFNNVVPHTDSSLCCSDRWGFERVRLLLLVVGGRGEIVTPYREYTYSE